MDRIEPKAGPDLQDLTFRRAPRWAEPESDGRFALGVTIFLIVALVYPWYSYWVQAHLLAHDLQEGVEQFTESMDRESRELSAQVTRQSQAARADAQAASAEARRQRADAVRVIGASDSDPPLVIVELGQASFYEANARICRQAEAWLGKPLRGRVIRVQRARPAGRAVAVEQLRCS